MYPPAESTASCCPMFWPSRSHGQPLQPARSVPVPPSVSPCLEKEALSKLGGAPMPRHLCICVLGLPPGPFPHLLGSAWTDNRARALRAAFYKTNQHEKKPYPEKRALHLPVVKHANLLGIATLFGRTGFGDGVPTCNDFPSAQCPSAGLSGAHAIVVAFSVGKWLGNGVGQPGGNVRE